MDKEITVLLASIKRAGEKILALQRENFTIANKANHELVTEADLKANAILQQDLLDHFPQDAWLSEENVDSFTRLTGKRVWIVDPIDGTKEFVKRIPEYAISVALIENETPIIAAVFNPATNELFHAQKGKGAWLNDKRIYCDASPFTKLKLLASRSEFERGEWDAFKTQEVKVVGSIAYKLALVAKGDAHATFSLGFKNEWDVAAGVLLVQEAGGMVYTKQQQLIRFNQPSPKVNGIVATTTRAYQPLFSLIQKATNVRWS